MGRTARFVVFIGGTLFVLAIGGYVLFSVTTGGQKPSETPMSASGTAQEQDIKQRQDRNRKLDWRVINERFIQFWTGYRDALTGRDLETAMALFDSSDYAFCAMRRTANLKAIEEADTIKVFHSGGYSLEPVKIQGAIVVTTSSLDVLDEFIYRLDPTTWKARSLVASGDECLPGHSSLARVLMDIGQFGRARKEYEAILQQCTQSQREKIEAYWGIGRTLFAEGRYEEALVNFEKCLEFAEKRRQKGSHLGSFPSYVYYVGLACFHVGNQQEARVHLERAMQLWEEAGSTSSEEFTYAEDVLAKIGGRVPESTNEERDK